MSRFITTVCLLLVNVARSQEYHFLESSQIPIIGYNAPFYVTKNNTNNCTTVIRNYDPQIHKRKYRVGVYSSEGDEVAFQFYNQTFNQYLTATAGLMFDPPIEFEMIPGTLTALMDMAESEDVDFTFASSAVSSCAATEHDAQPLVTIVNRREAQGRAYDLDQYGGVIFTLATNNEINSIHDLKDRTVGAGSITAMGGGQSQLYEMVRQGLSYVSDPKQVVFTNDETLIVQAVLDGEFEVGMARTDQIERHVDENGRHLDPSIFKIINAQIHTLEDGTLFPFKTSTSLHPEWPVMALGHVAVDVAKSVQEALLALGDHAVSIDLKRRLRCETTPAIAQLAKDCQNSGMLTGFRPARNYFSVRTKQQAAGFLNEDANGNWHCIRGETLYHDITCPDEFYKMQEKDFNRSCSLIGLECPKENYECYCKPCVHKSIAVDVFKKIQEATDVITPCEKLSACGTVEQAKIIAFRIVDRMERTGAIVTVTQRLDDRTKNLAVSQVEGEPGTYEFEFVQRETGMAIVEIAIDNIEIYDSPIRIEVVEKSCQDHMEPNDDGLCVCEGGTVDFSGRCLNSAIFAAVGAIAGFLCLVAIIVAYMRYKNYKADEMWKVHIDELLFGDPVEIIGQGSFGVVLLAEYRGTKVAIKHAVKSNGGGSKKGRRSIVHGSVVCAGGSEENVNFSRDSLRLGQGSQSPSLDDNISVDLGNNQSGDIESGTSNSTSTTDLHSAGISRNDDDFNLDFLAGTRGRRSRQWNWLSPWTKQDTHENRFKESILDTASASATRRPMGALLCPWWNEHTQLQQDFVKEMRVLSLLRHPCITTVMGAVITRSHNPMLVMEYMDYGSLYDLLRNETMYLTGETISQIARSIGQGLRYLHSSKPPILHGDLKARNILIDSRFRAKLCDFGLSSKHKGQLSGTPFWLAPEYLRGESDYDTKCDIYSVGILLFEIYSRKNPYEGEDFKEVLRRVCDRRINKRPDIPEAAPPKMADLMKRCWSRHKNFRPNSRDLDMTLMDLTSSDLEPLTDEQQKAGSRKRRSGDMLYELFPKHIADALADGKKVEPEHHELVTIVFSDIVNFTAVSQELGPLKVSNMLDNLYLAFDKIARRHNIFKVETIGDAYMGVTNLSNKMEHNHVKCAAEFAIDMINEASTILIDPDEPEIGYIKIRVGFHSGPVVSNVIGSLNPRYGLFGDTVNTASRMETNSTANRILCSERSYNLLKEQAPKIKTKKRGRIDVKGKGEMTCYWVGRNHLAKQKEQSKSGQSEPRVEFYEEPTESGDGEDKLYSTSC